MSKSIAKLEAEIECLKARVEIAEKNAALIYLKGSYVDTDGHLDICPTYYDWCNCTVGALKRNIKHAQKAKAALSAFRATAAAALRELRAEYEDCPLLGQEFAVELLDATIIKLGLADKAEGEKRQ